MISAQVREHPHEGIPTPRPGDCVLSLDLPSGRDRLSRLQHQNALDPKMHEPHERELTDSANGREYVSGVPQPVFFTLGRSPDGGPVERNRH